MNQQKNKLCISIYIIVLILFASCSTRKNLYIYIGSGFEKTKTTIIINTLTKDNLFVKDTLIYNKRINSNYSTGLSEIIKTKIKSKFIRIEIYFIFNDSESYLIFNKIKNGTQIVVEPSSIVDSTSTRLNLNYMIYDKDYQLRR